MDKVIILLEQLTNYLQGFGIVGGYFLILLESIIPALPLSVFIAFNIMAFGMFSGFLVSYFATVTGCMLSFIVFRYLIKDKILKIFHKKSIEKLEKLNKKISNIDFNALVVIIAMPFTPAFLVNIAAGLSNIKIKKFFIGLLIGKAAMIYFWCYVGKSFIDCLENPVLIIKLVLVVFISYVVSKIIEKVVKVEE